METAENRKQGDDPRENTSRNTHQAVMDLLRRHTQARKVLDIPCGEGAFTKRLMDAGLEPHSADVEDLILTPGARFKVCDIDRPLPYPDSDFDAVVCIDGIEHIERPFDFIRETHRILREEGVFLLSTPNISSLRSRWRWLLTGFHNKGKSPLNEARPSPLHHIQLLGFPILRYGLHRSGFRITALRANRVKAVSWLYAPLVPFSYAVTRRVFRKEEQDPEQRRRNREILRQMFLRPVLFGETLIVEAAKCGTRMTERP